MKTILQTTLAQHDRGLSVNPALKDQAISALVNKCCGLHASEDEPERDPSPRPFFSTEPDEGPTATVNRINRLSAGKLMAIHI